MAFFVFTHQRTSQQIVTTSRSHGPFQRVLQPTLLGLVFFLSSHSHAFAGSTLPINSTVAMSACSNLGTPPSASYDDLSMKSFTYELSSPSATGATFKKTFVDACQQTKGPKCHPFTNAPSPGGSINIPITWSGVHTGSALIWGTISDPLTDLYHYGYALDLPASVSNSTIFTHTYKGTYQYAWYDSSARSEHTSQSTCQIVNQEVHLSKEKLGQTEISVQSQIEKDSSPSYGSRLASSTMLSLGDDSSYYCITAGPAVSEVGPTYDSVVDVALVGAPSPLRLEDLTDQGLVEADRTVLNSWQVYLDDNHRLIRVCPSAEQVATYPGLAVVQTWFPPKYKNESVAPTLVQYIGFPIEEASDTFPLLVAAGCIGVVVALARLFGRPSGQ